MILNCPTCKNSLAKIYIHYYCHYCDKIYYTLHDIPILLTSDTELIKKWNNVARNFSNHYKISDNVMDVDPRILKTVRYLKTTPKSATILDVGCGAGHLLRLLQNMGFTNLIGTEISPDRLQIAEEHSTGIRYIASDTLNVFPDNSVDAITATGVIEHLEHPETFYKDCYRVLKPEGKLIVTSDCYLFRIQKFLGFYKTVQPIDNAPYPTTVIKTAEKAGFEVVHFDAWGSWWFHIYLAGTNFVSNIAPKFIRSPFVKIYEKGLRTATKHDDAKREFQVEDANFGLQVSLNMKSSFLGIIKSDYNKNNKKNISKWATLKCVCLIGDVFYFRKKNNL